MFTTAPRKTVQRQNSSSSIASTASSTSTILAPTAQTNGSSTPSSVEAGSWAARKKPNRGIWPPGKAEPATGISTARPQAVSSATSGPTASSAISALHAPLLPSQQMANGAVRNPTEPPAILHLLPINGTFERKTINVPYYEQVLKIGRQTNQKTIPTPTNGYFDSKVLSRQHAEVWADRQGRIFIKDVKSSNGTFVNGMRLSQENKESEPRELREQDVLELGIDIVSEDQKTVVHHKVAAKVEHAGIYGQGNDPLGFGELDPSVNGGLLAAPHPLKRTASQGSLNGRVAAGGMNGVQQGGLNASVAGQPQQMRAWLNPITTEQIVKKLNAEMRLAMQQSQDLARARQMIAHIVGDKVESPSTKDSKPNSEKSRSSPTKSKLDLKSQFSEPPAPPPQAPLPEKPDVARALADPVIRPLLRRDDTALPGSTSSSPTRPDHSGDILRLCEELKLAKGELSNQSERMKSLESELALERTARESAEERAQRFERRDSPTKNDERAVLAFDEAVSPTSPHSSGPDLQTQLDRLTASMDEMKQQMERYWQRAETAEVERDEARQSLAEMVEQKRRENADRGVNGRSASKGRKSPVKRTPSQLDGKTVEPNGHAVAPQPGSPTCETLLERAGVEEGQPITLEQAKIMTQLLTQEVLHPRRAGDRGSESALAYYGRPCGSAAAVVVFGLLLMSWVNGNRSPVLNPKFEAQYQVPVISMAELPDTPRLTEQRSQVIITRYTRTLRNRAPPMDKSEGKTTDPPYADEAAASISLHNLHERPSSPDSTTSQDLDHLLSDDDDDNASSEVSNDLESLPPVHGGRGAWTCLLGCWLVEAMIWGFPLAFGVFQRYYSAGDELFRPGSASGSGASVPTIGTLATGVSYLGMPFTNPVALRWPRWRRTMCVAGWGLCLLGLVCASFAQEVWQLVLFQGFVYGLGWVICYTPFLFMLNEWFVERRGLAYGILFGASGVSGMVIPVVVGWMLERYGFRVALRVYAGATVVISGPGLLLIRPRARASRDVARTTLRRGRTVVQALRPYATNVHFLIMAAAVFVQGLGFFIPNIYISSFAEGLGLSTSAGSGLLALVSLSQVLGQCWQGWASDKVNIYLPLSISALVPGLGALILWGQAKGLAYLAPFAITWGLFSASYSVLYTRMCSFLTEMNVGPDDHDNISMLLYGFFSFERGINGKRLMETGTGSADMRL
ncbi:hypothetical protein B0A55_08244 [Friedmanniomyces simplex]|uniref:FHA domain-containing protein n=1 Tax=Friedmanniomyces simplex TaxID=329884 RepID=A0A4U0WTL6_9PEZI|nr:hypothetical protein B0A55_08244 [Friedmanniomyces simplex]